MFKGKISKKKIEKEDKSSSLAEKWIIIEQILNETSNIRNYKTKMWLIYYKILKI